MSAKAWFAGMEITFQIIFTHARGETTEILEFWTWRLMSNIPPIQLNTTF